MRLLFVHAHPDDETLATGISLAHHVRKGDDVHVLTCTLGEEGEVIPEALAHLEGADGDPLAAHRLQELRAAMDSLGVTLHLLAPHAQPDQPFFRDSGMRGSAAFAHPRAFAAAPLPEIARHVGQALADINPDVVVTYDAHGGYGHPDHIRVHDAVVAALRAVAPQARPHLYAVLTPQSWASEDRAWLTAHRNQFPADWVIPAEGDPFAPSVVSDDLVTHATIDPDCVPAQANALSHHETQVITHDGAYALSNLIAARLSGREGFARIDPDVGAVVTTRHTDGVVRPGLR